ncbi:MAG: protein kinase [Nannocystaceae bacterium]
MVSCASRGVARMPHRSRPSSRHSSPTRGVGLAAVIAARSQPSSNDAAHAARSTTPPALEHHRGTSMARSQRAVGWATCRPQRLACGGPWHRRVARACTPRGERGRRLRARRSRRPAACGHRATPRRVSSVHAGGRRARAHLPAAGRTRRRHLRQRPDPGRDLADEQGLAPRRCLRRGPGRGREARPLRRALAGRRRRHRPWCSRPTIELDRKVAIKLLRGAPGGSGPKELADQRARLLREAQAMAKLSHANVITVHDVGTIDGQVFVAMEFIDGSTLSAWLRERRRSWREVMTVLLAAGRGLAAAPQPAWSTATSSPTTCCWARTAACS